LTIVWGEKNRKWNKNANEQQPEPEKAKQPGDLRVAISKAVKYLASEGAKPAMPDDANQSTNPNNNIYMSLTGLPLRIQLEWPFHKSTSGSDFWVLHGDIRLESAEGLHAPVAVNMSATVHEVMPSLEPKDVLAPVLNALRKQVDTNQIEFLKSGKLVPVNFSSRYYDFKHNQWVFGHASDEIITALVERKIYWQTKLMGGDVWLGDGADAQYLQTTADHVAQLADGLAGRGLIRLERRYATALPALMARAEEFESLARSTLAELEKKHAFERG
jgi:hypothetical protein